MSKSVLLVMLSFLVPGIAQTQVNDCLPTVDGETWVATDGGLLRLDANGNVQQRWRHSEGLTKTSAHTLRFVDETLLVGTDGGLVQMGKQLKTVVESAPVRSITPYDGSLILGTWGDGLLRFKAGQITSISPKRSRQGRSHTRITAVTVHDESLIVGTAGAGLWHVSDKKMTPLALPNRWITDVVSYQGVLWVGTLAGVVRIDKSTVTEVNSMLVRAMTVTEDELLMVNGEGEVLKINRQGQWRTLQSLGIQLSAITQAHGVTCVGGKSGLFIQRGKQWEVQDLEGLPDQDVSALIHDGDRMWAGLFKAGLAVLENGYWHSVPGIDTKVNGLARAKNGGVWVATARGLYRVHGRQIQHLTERDGLPSNDVHAITTLRSGEVLVGTKRGAAILGEGPIETLGRKQGASRKSVWAVAEGPGGRLLLGCSDGLYVRERGQWSRLSVASGHLPDDWITAIVVDEERAWVGTYNAGVVALEWGDQIMSTPLEGGWINFNGLTVYKGTLYAATMDGLLQRGIDDSAWQTVTDLPAKDVTAVVPVDDSLWVATRRGVTAIRLFAGGSRF